MSSQTSTGDTMKSDYVLQGVEYPGIHGEYVAVLALETMGGFHLSPGTKFA